MHLEAAREGARARVRGDVVQAGELLDLAAHGLQPRSVEAQAVDHGGRERAVGRGDVAGVGREHGARGLHQATRHRREDTPNRRRVGAGEAFVGSLGG